MKAVAAIFLERLATSAVSKTSSAVLDILRSRHGFATGILQSLIYHCEAGDCTDWKAVGSIAGAGIALAALYLHNFGAGLPSRSSLPPATTLLWLIEKIMKAGEYERGLDTLNKWRMLLTVQFGTGSSEMSSEEIFTVSDSLLDPLCHKMQEPRWVAGFPSLVERDGAEAIAFGVMTLVSHLSDKGNAEREIKLLGRLLRGATGLSSSRVSSPKARCALYTCIAIIGGLVMRDADDRVGVSPEGHLKNIQISDADGFISTVCSDAVGSPSAAEKAAAMIALTVVLRLDSKDTIPALASNNRLRRVVASALSDPDVKRLGVKACSKNFDQKVKDDDRERDRAVVVIAEAGIAVVHAVAAAPDGARALADGACIESAASLLAALSVLDEYSDRLWIKRAQNLYGDSPLSDRGLVMPDLARERSKLENPMTIREFRRAGIVHPEHGSLFERGVMRARANCIRNILGSLRARAGLTDFFRPSIWRRRKKSLSLRANLMQDEEADV